MALLRLSICFEVGVSGFSLGCGNLFRFLRGKLRFAPLVVAVVCVVDLLRLLVPRTRGHLWKVCVPIKLSMSIFAPAMIFFWFNFNFFSLLCLSVNQLPGEYGAGMSNLDSQSSSLIS